MKILQINNCHYRRGGADIVYLNTIELLKKHGHEVISFSKKSDRNLPSDSEQYFVEEINYFKSHGLKKLFLFFRFFFSFESKNKLEKLIRETKPDIAHIHLYKGDLTPSIFIALKKMNVPVVITLHDFGLLCPHNIHLDGKLNICERCIDGSTFNCVVHRCNRNNLLLSSVSALEFQYQKTLFSPTAIFDKIITVSEFSKNMHLKTNRFNNKIEKIYNFAPFDDGTPNTKKGDYFLFFGRLSDEKGINTLINAWVKRPRSSKLLILGEGPLSEFCKSQALKYSDIEVLGFKTGSELKNLISGSSFVIVPSECYENNPLAIVESYKSGKPVIGTNIGGIPELINENETGYLFELKDPDQLDTKICMAEKVNEEEYFRMSNNALLFAKKNFDEDSHYQKLIGVFDEVLKERRNK